jgi:hypothetical protein
MTLRRCAIALTALMVCSLVQVSAAADITGKWTASFDTQIGEQKYTYDFQLKGSQLTGTAASENGTSEIKNGKVDGETVTFVEILNFQGMVLEISYTGTIVSADQIDFTRKVADIATEKLVAKRVK